MPFTPDAIIYHFPCPDGFASAYVAHQRWPEADLIPTNYGKPFKFEELKGKAVLIVDFSFPLDQLLGLAAMCNGVLVLDHHKTAAEALAVVPAPNSHRADECIVEPEQLRAWFDMEHSGVSMTWAFCFGSQPDDPPASSTGSSTTLPAMPSFGCCSRPTGLACRWSTARRSYPARSATAC
jgi:hypothetical protein